MAERMEAPLMLGAPKQIATLGGKGKATGCGKLPTA